MLVDEKGWSETTNHNSVIEHVAEPRSNVETRTSDTAEVVVTVTG